MEASIFDPLYAIWFSLNYTSPAEEKVSAFCSEEAQLLLPGRIELAAVEPRLAASRYETEAPAGCSKALAEQVGIGAAARLANAEAVSEPTSEVKSVEVIEVEVSPEDSDPRQVVVPIHVTMDPDAEEAELHVALFIKIRRAKS